MTINLYVKKGAKYVDGKTIRILLIQNNVGDDDLVKKMLLFGKNQYIVCHADRLSTGIERLLDGNIDVVLTDLTLPDIDDAHAVTRIHALAPDIPVIVLTSFANDTTALDSLEDGAQDYLVKDEISLGILERAIQYAIHRQQSQTEIQDLLSQVQDHEKLLEVKNRRLRRLYKTAQEFVDNVSHEFRTPLTVIKEYASLLREGVLGDVNTEQSQFLDVVSDRADDLNQMVNDMLDVSRLEADLLGISRSSCKVADIFERVSPAIQRKGDARNVTLEFCVPNDLPEVFCDGEKIGRVITNLANNAIKFCKENCRVRIWARKDNETKDIVIGVTDNGPGIDEDRLAVIFERFRQLGHNTRSSTKGFGLGLNIAKQLVDLNFGHMRVKSKRGRGSTFSFTVPMDQPIEITQRYLRRIRCLNDRSSVIALMRIDVDPSVDSCAADDVDAFLNSLLRRHDLLFRFATGHWVQLLWIGQFEIEKYYERVNTAIHEANRNRLHGPLPKINIELEQTLCLAEEENQIIKAIRQNVPSREAVYA